jgi:5-methylcytosine-specific restriction endonuclease McrA
LFDFITAENVHTAILSLEYFANIWRIEGTEGRITDDHDWQVLRRITFDNQGRFCCNCKRSDTRLDVHHIVPIGSERGTNHLSNLCVLCHECHKSIHPWMST